MLKNEEISQKHPFFRKGLNNFEVEWNYMWLHLHSSQKRVKKLLWLCGYWVPKCYFSWPNQVAITLSYRYLAKDASKVPSFTFILHVHRQAKCCSETFFGNSLSKLCSRHLQSFLVTFNRQVQNTEKSKASFVEVVWCFAAVKARIQ